MTVWEKLHKDRETKDGLVRVMQDLKRQVDESKISQMISTTSQVLSQSKKPSEFYLQQAAERRDARLRTYLRSSKPTFKPQILHSSRKLASSRPDSRQGVFERLYSARTSDTSLPDSFIDKPANGKQVSDDNEIPFLNRQRIDADTRKWKERLRYEMQQRKCSFTPRLNSKSEEIAVKRGRDGDVVRRLAVDDIRHRTSNQAQRFMEADPECRFVPEIDSRSDAIASIKRVFDNCSVHDKLYHGPPMTPARSPRSDAGPPEPKPSRPKSAYNHVRAHYNLRNPDLTLIAIDNAKRDREEIRKQVLREREERELAECTFQPRVNKYREDRGGPILVAGLDRFVNTRDLGRRMSEIGRVPSFREYESSAHEGTLTIPQPFILSGTSD